MDFVLGIDGGGTSCRAALATADGRILSRAKSGAANIRTDLTGARASIVEAARLAFIEAGQDPELIPATPALLVSSSRQQRSWQSMSPLLALLSITTKCRLPGRMPVARSAAAGCSMRCSTKLVAR